MPSSRSKRGKWEGEKASPSSVALRGCPFTHYILLPLQLLQNIKNYAKLSKPLNDALIHAIVGHINGGRRTKGDSLFPQSPYPEPLLHVMLQDSCLSTPRFPTA